MHNGDVSTRESALPWVSAHGDDSNTHINSRVFVSTSPAVFPSQPEHRWVGRPTDCVGPAWLSHHSCWHPTQRRKSLMEPGEFPSKWNSRPPGEDLPQMAQHRVMPGPSSLPVETLLWLSLKKEKQLRLSLSLSPTRVRKGLFPGQSKAFVHNHPAASLGILRGLSHSVTKACLCGWVQAE